MSYVIMLALAAIWGLLMLFVTPLWLGLVCSFIGGGVIGYLRAPVARWFNTKLFKEIC